MFLKGQPAAPLPPPDSHDTLRVLSQILGWAYFVAWSLSFYPQTILNYRRKSVIGLSFDFVVLNALGFSCLSAVSAAFLFSEEVRREYAKRNDGKLPLVDLNDLIFALHALLLTCVVLFQTTIYERGRQRVSGWVWTFLGVALALITAQSVWVTMPLASRPYRMHINWLDVVYLMSYVKLATSTVKYVPQALLNMSRASTSGWSIENIILDTTGGILSLAQLLLDAYISGHWEGVTGNPAKLGMAFLSLGFDSVFFFQHFCLYAEAPNVAVVEEEAGRSGSRASRRNGRTSRAEGARETDPLLGSQTPEPAATTTV